jgi:hypothetical protein
MDFMQPKDLFQLDRAADNSDKYRETNKSATLVVKRGASKSEG